MAGKRECDLPPDIEAKLDDLRLIIRRAETSKAKMEARIELLKEGGGEKGRDFEINESFDESMCGKEIF